MVGRRASGQQCIILASSVLELLLIRFFTFIVFLVKISLNLFSVEERFQVYKFSGRLLYMYRVATVRAVMEKSWNFWNFEIFWNFWKSHGISPKIDEGHGKVMEFWNYGKKSWDLHIYKSSPIPGKKNPTNRFCPHSLWSWNFVVRSWKSHGILSQKFRGNPDVALMVMVITSP